MKYSQRKLKKKKIVIDPKTYVTTTFELDDAMKSRIKSIFGSEDEYVFLTDNTIIGGITIKKHGKLFDGSITNILNQLHSKIISA